MKLLEQLVDTDVSKHRDITDLNLRFIVNTYKYNPIEISPNRAFSFMGSFYSLLQFLKVPSDYWYVNLRINKLKSSVDYDGNPEGIVILRDERYLKLIKMYAQRKTTL